MPTYDYICSNCGKTSEIVHSINGGPPAACPACGAVGTLRKSFNPPTIHFKGSGWAKKDRSGGIDEAQPFVGFELLERQRQRRRLVEIEQRGGGGIELERLEQLHRATSVDQGLFDKGPRRRTASSQAAVEQGRSATTSSSG